MKKNIYYALLCLCLVGKPLNAQHLLGIANSNYAGTHAIHMNPAHIADNRYGFFMNLASFQVGASNNAVYYKGKSLISQAIDGSLDKLGAENFSLYGGNGKKMLNVGAQIRLPVLNFMVQMSPKHSFAITSRVRSLGSINAISPELVALANEPTLDNSKFTNTPINNMTYNANLNFIGEAALSYARVVINNEKHFLKAGGTFKYLKGISAYTQIKKIDFTIKTDQPTGIPTQTQDIIDIRQVDMQVGSSIGSFDDITLQDILKGAGGVGFDVGAVYEFRPDWEDYTYTMDGVDGLQDKRENKYMLKVGVSLMDIGGTKYKTSRTRVIKALTNNNNLDEKERQRIENDPFLADSVRKSLGGDIIQSDNFRAGLPTALHITADYRITNHIYANLTYIQNMRGRFAIGARQASLLAITPRIEFHGFELAFPLSLQNGMRNFAFGTAIKLGYLFLGSDNLAGALNMGKVNGADVYFGLSLPVRTPKKKRDKDEDGISDKLDDCKDIAGIWDFKGCPDSDGDKIKDQEDECPSEAGSADFKGCPDRDGDKVRDKDDTCPDVAGLIEFKGCPDKDGDKIQDKEDECPDVAGLVEFQGCPDTDGDKIEDKEDKCPEVAGLVEFQGCPDTDGDRIQDKEDACPDKAGLPQFKGCPDTDADGIMDKEDACPTVVGVRENNGCPEVKNAPPVITEEEKEVLKEVFESLEFEYGKTVIAQKSQESLRELAVILKKKERYRLSIEGHTDNVGNAQNNLKLSADRAKAVKTFLEKEGVRPAQLVSEGFGDKRPIADNKTEEGKKRNRRVEFKIIK